MTMQKFGVEEDTQKLGLLDEEAQLMTSLGRLMSTSEKSASESNEQMRIERRLQQVRTQISQLDKKL